WNPASRKVARTSSGRLPCRVSRSALTSTTISKSVRQAFNRGAIPATTDHSAPSTSILITRAARISSGRRIAARGAAFTTQASSKAFVRQNGGSTDVRVGTAKQPQHSGGGRGGHTHRPYVVSAVASQIALEHCEDRRTW